MKQENVDWIALFLYPEPGVNRMRTEVWPTEKLTLRGIHILGMSVSYAERLPWHGRMLLRLRTMWNR
jgi:hypothetical protein